MSRLTMIAIFAAGFTAVTAWPTRGIASVVKGPGSTASGDVLLDLDAKIFPLEGADATSDPVGKFHADTKKDGDGVHSYSVFSDANGPQLIEQSWEVQGQVVRATLEDKLLKKTHSLEVKDGKVYYKSQDLNDHSESTSDEDAADNRVVPSTIVSYMRSHSVDLGNGKTVKVRMMVMDRKDSYEFEVRLVRSEKLSSGETAAVLELRPCSFFVRAVVSPMYFYVDPNSFELIAYKGRSSFRMKDGSSYKDLIAKTLYTYSVDRVKPAQGLNLNGKPCDADSNLLNAAKCAIPTDPETTAPAASSSK